VARGERPAWGAGAAGAAFQRLTADCLATDAAASPHEDHDAILPHPALCLNYQKNL
jgi:hypothetical protein